MSIGNFHKILTRFLDIFVQKILISYLSIHKITKIFNYFLMVFSYFLHLEFCIKIWLVFYAKYLIFKTLKKAVKVTAFLVVVIL
jgi:hypothetical protein